MRFYTDYVAGVSEHGLSPISEELWGQLQSTLPAALPITMPLSMNRSIALAMEAGDHVGAAVMVNQCEEHDRECWLQYTTEGQSFPAGGLWLNHAEWVNGSRPQASPLVVAYMLDFDGDLPPVAV